MDGHGWLAWNDLLAAGLRAIRPVAVRAQVVHFVADALVPGVAEGRSESSRRSWRTPRRRAGAAAPGGSPRRCCPDQEAERDDELSDHHACSIGGLQCGR